MSEDVRSTEQNIKVNGITPREKLGARKDCIKKGSFVSYDSSDSISNATSSRVPCSFMSPDLQLEGKSL